MHWRYEWVSALSVEVYDVLIEMLKQEARESQE
jgi:hypothetical protein